MSREPITWAKIFRVIANLLIATVCGLTFGLTIQGIFISMAQDSILGSRDFVVFWTTGAQLAHHANPYDPVALLRIERAAGLPTLYGVMFMRNLPFALPLVYPLGFLSLRLASILWTVFLLACLVSSVYMLWLMHGRSKNVRHWLGYSFGPALISLIMGQSTLFALLGLVLFLRWHGTRPFLAGISLWLCMLKPHLFLPFGVVLLAWIAVTRSYKILAGVAVALAASLWITYLIDPMAWSQYAQMARRSGIQSEFIPCISVVLRDWISKGSMWLQYLPSLLACVWALSYFWPRRFTWNWVKHNGSLLMLVSLVTAPYSWIYDAGIAIPALLQGAYVTRSRSVLVALALLSALVEVALFGNLFKPAAIHSWTIWSAPAWLAWYLIASTPLAKWKDAWPALRSRKWFGVWSTVKASSDES
jgi:hypothetical protein